MRKKILIATCIVVGCSIVGLIAFNSGIFSKEEEIELSPHASGITSDRVTKSVGFNTEEEMMEYATKINNIGSVEEGVEFISQFLMLSSENNYRLVLGYYHPSIREYVHENGGYPVFDNTNALTYNIRDIEVVAIGDSLNKYKASYKVDLFSKKTGEKLETIVRSDKFELVKEFERIYIYEYIRKTTGGE